MADFKPDDYSEVHNARVEYMRIGSLAHDNRGFFTIGFDGGGWGQGCSPAFTPEILDLIIDVCGVDDLQRCIGRYVRVCWATPLRGSGPSIAAFAHITDDTKIVALAPPRGGS
jgi:hypothetical protein